MIFIFLSFDHQLGFLSEAEKPYLTHATSPVCLELPMAVSQVIWKALVTSHEGCVDIKNTRAPPGNSTVRQVQSLTYFRSSRNLSVCLLL